MLPSTFIRIGSCRTLSPHISQFNLLMEELSYAKGFRVSLSLASYPILFIPRFSPPVMTLGQKALAEKFCSTVDYIFGDTVSSSIDLNSLSVEISRTGRLRRVYSSQVLLATVKSDGGIALTIAGAKSLVRHPSFARNCVRIIEDEEIEGLVKKGRSVFSSHVTHCGDLVRVNSEVVVLDHDGDVLAVGKAVLPSQLMLTMSRGVGVKVRVGLAS